MYQFTALKDIKDYYPGQKIMNLQLFTEYNEVKIQGILRTLFGEPLYETDNYEDAYCYMIKADDMSGKSVLFSVYQGSSGCAIGSVNNVIDMFEAIDEFKELVRKTKPLDFVYEGIYRDSSAKIRQGIQNGQIIYEEKDLYEEDEL